ncbi:MAG: conjugal transfer protein TraI, partial [Pseudomonadota bacterium]
MKVHIARARSGIGARAYSRHLDYIQRDGVDRDGEGGQLYGRGEELIDGRAFAARSADDRHQFRIIVSPEDADQLGELKDHTRKLMTEMERDLGTRLDWVAVDHHNTGHAHTHIVIRGKDGLGQDLVIARDYLTKGLRARAEEMLTQELGPRRDIEIIQSRHQEMSQDRFTGLDREIAKQAINSRVELTAPSG